MRFFIVLLALASVVFGQEKKVSRVKVRETIATAVVTSGPDQTISPSEFFAARFATSMKIKFVALKFSLLSDFDKLYEGDPRVTSQILNRAGVKKVLAGKLNYKFRQSSLMSNGIVCEATLSYRLILANGDIITSDVLMLNHNDSSEGTSLIGAIDKIVKELVENLSKLP